MRRTVSVLFEIFRKALHVYLAPHDGTRGGLKLGLVESVTKKLQTIIVELMSCRLGTPAVHTSVFSDFEKLR